MHCKFKHIETKYPVLYHNIFVNLTENECTKTAKFLLHDVIIYKLNFSSHSHV